MDPPGIKIIDEIGSDAVPYLMEATKPKHYIVSSKFYNAAYAKLPAALAKHLPVPRDAIEIRCRAYRGLQHLGPSAKSAVPLLIQQFNTNNYLLNWVDDTLAMIGPAGKEGIPALSNAFHGPDRTLRINTARVLARIDPTNPELMPTMLVWLQDTDAIPRRSACLA